MINQLTGHTEPLLNINPRLQVEQTMSTAMMKNY